MNLNGIDIVLLFSILLFSRLGLRLVRKYIDMKKGDDE